VRQVPGFTIRDAPQERGLGEASANVLLNGRRISGKSEDVGAQLNRIPARNVVRIEIRDGATLNVPGLSGQVANIITRATGMSGQFSWSPEIRAYNTNPVINRVNLSVTGTQGPLEYTLGVENQSGASGADGPTAIFGPTGTLVETRDDVVTSTAEQPRISGRFVIEGPGSSVGSISLSYRQFHFNYEEIGQRRGPGQVDRTRSLVSQVDGHQYDVGGDFDFAVGSGRLKLIALNRVKHEPVVQTATTDFANLSPRIGSRFSTAGDESERIGRAEYRWRRGGADWQVSAEAAFNSLDSISQLLILRPSGVFEPVPFGGPARVEEDRYQLIASYGRPL
jgi:hypothetical protein